MYTQWVGAWGRLTWLGVELVHTWYLSTLLIGYTEQMAKSLECSCELLLVPQAKPSVGTSRRDEMSGRKGGGSESANFGMLANALDELKESLVERIMCKMASMDDEEADPSRQVSSGGEWTTIVRRGWGNTIRDRTYLPLCKGNEIGSCGSRHLSRGFHFQLTIAMTVGGGANDLENVTYQH